MALEGTKAFRVESEVYGRKRTLVVSWHQGLFEAQWATVQSELARALRKLGELQQSLERRQQGEVKGAKAPTIESVQKQCREILHRERLSQVVASDVRPRGSGVPELNYRVQPEALERLRDTVLGKNVLVTSHGGWSNAQVVEAYRSQFLIEEIFQQMKDRDVGCWWPMFHWTDRMIQVHGLYCTIALLLRAMVGRQVREAGVELPLTRLWAELEQVREVVNVYEGRGARKLPVQQRVRSKLTVLQERLVEVLGLRGEKRAVEGIAGGFHNLLIRSHLRGTLELSRKVVLERSAPQVQFPGSSLSSLPLWEEQKQTKKTKSRIQGIRFVPRRSSPAWLS